jgi:DNA-binding NarL/FixJ family response regulator
VKRCSDYSGERLPAAPSGRVAVADIELLEHLSHGLALEVIARRMNLSERTIRRRARRICDEIGVGTPVEAVVWAVRNGLL